MQAVHRVEGIAVPFLRANVDTDQITPARFIMKPRDFDYGTALFHDLRHGPSAEADFPLDRPPYRGAKIIVTGENFACGSAREQSVWALQDAGIVVVIGPSFGGIFHANCLKNGVLPAIVDAPVAAAICGALEARPGSTLGVDLDAQAITMPGGGTIAFRIDPVHKARLQSGKDDIERTLEHEGAILEFERELGANATWTRPAFAEAIRPGRRVPLHPADDER